MSDIAHDFLLLLWVAVPPALFGLLLYLGLAIGRDERKHVITTPKPKDCKHPYSHQP